MAGWEAALDDQKRVFMGMLTHDDRDSHYVIASNADGRWHQRAYRAAAVMDAPLPHRSSVYMTRNGFSGKKRTSESCRQVNAMMFDIDCHGEGFATQVPSVIGALEDACFEGVLPQPNMVVNTGRGVQVYYVLERSISYLAKNGEQNGRALAYYKDVEAGIAEAMKGVVDGVEGAVLDESVADYARVGRVPGTYNPKARAWCTLVSCSDAYYDLKELGRYSAKRSWSHIKRNVAKTARKRSGLLVSRLHGIERLQAHRGYDCTGSRENMCFVYYNTATQVYGPEKALSLTMALNGKFRSPLPHSDIEQIARTVDKNVVLYGEHRGEVGFYPLKAFTVAEKLFMTRDEMTATKFFGGKRDRDRAQAKAKNAAKRANRDDNIVRQYRMGRTQAAIAESVGCSVRKVAYALRDAGVTRADRFTLEEKFALVIAEKQEHAKTCQTSWLCTGNGQKNAAQKDEDPKGWMTGPHRMGNMEMNATLFGGRTGPIRIHPVDEVPE